MAAAEHPIRKVTSFVLDEWAMMLVEQAENPEAVFNQEEPFFRVSAHYKGVFDGDLTIICQAPFLDVLAGNVLGIDEGGNVEDCDRWDALRELANIISGNYLVEAYGDETVFDLPSFELQQTSFEAVQGYITDKLKRYAGEAAAVYLADGQPIFVSFDIDATEYSKTALGEA